MIFLLQRCSIWKNGAIPWVVKTYSTKKCWTTYIFIQCQQKTPWIYTRKIAWPMYITACSFPTIREKYWSNIYHNWDSYPKEENLEVGALALENLDIAPFDDHHHVEMPPSPTAMFNPTKTTTTWASGKSSSLQLPPHPHPCVCSC